MKHILGALEMVDGERCVMAARNQKEMDRICLQSN